MKQNWGFQHHIIWHSGSHSMVINHKFSRNIYSATEMSFNFFEHVWAYPRNGENLNTFLTGFKYFSLLLAFFKKPATDLCVFVWRQRTCLVVNRGFLQNTFVFSIKIISWSFWFLLTARCVSFWLSAALLCDGRTWWACSLSLYWKAKSFSKEHREHWAYSCRHLMTCKKQNMPHSTNLEPLIRIDRD